MPASTPANTSAPARLRLALIALVLLLAGLATFFPPSFLADAEERLRDHMLRRAASAAPEDRLAIIDIDETSLAELGPWPWPRGRLADLVETLLADYRVPAVALDMVLPEPADPAGDRRLALLAEQGPLVLAVAFDFIPRQPPLAIGHLGAGQPADPARSALRATGHIANHAGLANARCLGNIGYQPGADGVLRSLPTNVRFQDRDYPSLAAALLACGAPAGTVPPPPTFTAADGRWRLTWRQSVAYLVIPAADILAARTPEKLLAGRRILVGASALGLADRVATPLEAASPGVLVHAVAASALLDEPRGQGPWPGNRLALGFALALALLALWLLPRLPAWGGALTLLLGTLAWLPVAYRSVVSGAEFSLAAPVHVGLGLLILVVPFEWWQAQRANRRIVGLFSHYVSPAVLDELLNRSLADTLAPAQREITVLIADMEGYTGHVARLSLPEATRLTRDFLGILTHPVLETGGTLDKYTGDGLVAFWGAPLPSPDAPLRALAAARGMLDGMAEFNRRRTAAGAPPVRLRIGIESGSAIVGDLGTPFRSAYTAVGDCINFAAKLQEAARDQAADLLIGPGTSARLPVDIIEPVARLALRGGNQPVTVCTLKPDPPAVACLGEGQKQHPVSHPIQ